MFKKLICTLLLLTLFVCGCGKNNPKDDLETITKRGKLIVGVRNDTKPFGYKDINGTLQGYDIDLAKYIAKDILGDEEAVEFISRCHIDSQYDKVIKELEKIIISSGRKIPQEEKDKLILAIKSRTTLKALIPNQA